ncbi:MAG: bifunctional (p)ppGpp synthetase/guanosine-3',5'-bis(diphosphate) 3'-pyrophosphohydrolase, partial [Firmicutes bacterium]|nr:bifunctional (p)ppGpp synthetase/guanosine-3',5'-bis(diphosphate) 3'-pyrophosphohydrolase [Bacillota bacterium]
VGAKINGKIVTIDHQLENGDIIEIVTNPNAVGPSIDWLKIAKSSTARTKIRQWLKKENKTDSVDKGKDLFDKYIRKKGSDPRELLKNSNVNRLVKELEYKNSDELYTQLANGGNLQTKVYNLLMSYEKEKREEEEAEQEKTLLQNLREMSERVEKRLQNVKKHEDNSGVVVEGVDNLMIRIAHCCSPVPGDEIIGYITKGRGITVHRKDCDNIRSIPEDERARCIDVEWDQNLNENNTYITDISIIAKDQKRMISNISKVCDDIDVRIDGLQAKADKEDRIRIELILGIRDKSQVEKICRSLKSIPGIIDAYRAKA